MSTLCRIHALAAALLLTTCAAPAPTTPSTPTAQAATLAPSTPATRPAAATPSTEPEPTPNPSTATALAYGYEVVNTFPHDPGAFTQGLVFSDGVLFESTGLNGQSSLRRVALETGEVLKQRDIDAQYFAEGLALFDGRLIQLTWRNGVGFVYDKDSFEPLGNFTYPNEGWGLTQDGTHLIMSDGSSTLRFLDPHTFEVVREVAVTSEGQPVVRLNELEYVAGEIWANVWQTDAIARIDPATGAVRGWIDLSGLLPAEERAAADVLNGIAYDAAGDRLFVTGKLWPTLFEIRVAPPASRVALPLV
jgi:glutamine cyclotransferase